MTEEIIKVIKDMQRKRYMAGYCDYVLDSEKAQHLLNYITNLQQENEFLKLNNPEQNMEHFRIVKENKRKIDNLRKENKRLKEELKNRPIVDFTFDVYKDLKELEDYKSRCEKAMELLKLPIVYETHQENGERDELLKKIRQAKNILNGSDGNETNS